MYLVAKPLILEWGWRWLCCDRDQYLVSMITKQFSSNVCTITRPLALTHLFKGLVTKHATVKWTIMHLNADCMIIRVYFPSQPVDCLKKNSQITICWQSMVVRDTWEQYIDFGVLHPVWTVSFEITQKCWACKPISWLVVLPLRRTKVNLAARR